MPRSTYNFANEPTRHNRCAWRCAPVAQVAVSIFAVICGGQRNVVSGFSTQWTTTRASPQLCDVATTTRLNAHESSRRSAIAVPMRFASAAAVAAAPWAMPQASAAEGLAAKLSKRDAAALKNSVFNLPPAAQVYPPFMRGKWDVTMKFRGFIFPSKTITKERLAANTAVPGFQKCSIAAIGDVGKEEARYVMDIDPTTGLEDRQTSLLTSVNSHLGYDALREVIYDVSSNPNRLSLDFVPNRTRNANRIELFCNGRESEFLTATPDDPSSSDAFVHSEYVRQVTFGLSQEFGVARQVIGNYAHFWTWRAPKSGADPSVITGNLLTAVYIDPQDAMFFDEPSKPVAVYSHDLVARRAST